MTETTNAIPTSVSVTDRDAAEADLARYAHSFDPTSPSKIGRHILAHLDQDGPQPREGPEPAPGAGELRLRERRDGRLGLDGLLAPEHSAAFRTLIDQLAAPQPATEGTPDPRTTDQRHADTLLEVRGLARAAHDCPTTAGEPPHLSVTLTWDALRTGLGAATLDYGTHLTASQARRWACDAKNIPLLLGGTSEPLDVGRAMRTVPLSLRQLQQSVQHLDLNLRGDGEPAALADVVETVPKVNIAPPVRLRGDVVDLDVAHRRSHVRRTSNSTVAAPSSKMSTHSPVTCGSNTISLPCLSTTRFAKPLGPRCTAQVMGIALRFSRDASAVAPSAMVDLFSRTGAVVYRPLIGWFHPAHSGQRPHGAVLMEPSRPPGAEAGGQCSTGGRPGLLVVPMGAIGGTPTVPSRLGVK
ncbi:MAG: DUF222 domain-containing protein [Pseudonocardiales bacterium]|nr:DUF222 domain-containing protein [Pseudonocardiales bacterium]